jgi:hypothetical protein
MPVSGSGHMPGPFDERAAVVKLPCVVDRDFIVLGRLVFKRHRPAAHRPIHGGAPNTRCRESSRFLFQPALDRTRLPAQIRFEIQLPGSSQV